MNAALDRDLTKPLYGTITLTRFRDGIRITCAPTVALIAPEVLFAVRSRIKVVGDMVTLGDQVVYRITGWDREYKSFIVLLEEDRR